MRYNKQLQDRLEDINTKLSYHGIPGIALRTAYGKYGIDNAASLSHLTALMTGKDCNTWLSAFESGIDYFDINYIQRRESNT